MKKSEMIEVLANKTGLTKADCEKVSVSGFGVFKISERSAREGRNPQTGEKIKIAASKSVSFKAGTELKTKLN